MGISRTFAKSLATPAGNALHGMGHVTDVTVADISDGREPTCILGKDIEARHLSEFQQYLTDSVLHDGTPLSETSRPQGQGQGSERAADQDDHNQDEDDEDGCDCRDDDFAADDVDDEGGSTCTARHGDSCDCVANTGNFYSTPGPSAPTEEQVLHLDALPARLPLVECSTRCSCSTQCTNRLTQRGVRVPLTIRPIKDLGLGAFYTPSNSEPLPQGRFIALYAGEYLTTSQARARWSSASSSAEREEEGKGNYILSLRVGTANDEVWHIDPRYRGNVGRFLNHSCQPNCVIHLVYWGTGAHNWPRAAIFTKKVVQAGEELTFDYANASGDTLNTPRSPDGDEASRLDIGGTSHKRVKCLCEAGRCRGWMPFDETL